jgi:hypothetical protein
MVCAEAWVKQVTVINSYMIIVSVRFLLILISMNTVASHVFADGLFIFTVTKQIAAI